MSAATTPVRLHVYFKLPWADAERWRARWREAATQACAALPGLQLVLSERPEAEMTWMESYRGQTPAQMADGEAWMARAMTEMNIERHREVFVETFRAG